VHGINDALISQVLSLLPIGLGIIAGLYFVGITAFRPAFGCCVFAFAISLTAGLGRGTIVPLLRPNEALLLGLLAGLFLYQIRRGRRHPVTGMDLAVGAFAIGAMLIPFGVLFYAGSPELRNIDTIRNILSPLQFLLVYLVFSRTDLSSRGQQAALQLTMLASVLVGLLAVGELTNLPGVRTWVITYFPAPVTLSGLVDPGYRPTSTLGHYSAVGAFGTINYALALALATARHPAFNRIWLTVVMTVNVVALVASLTWAPLLVLPLVTGVILWQGRRVPRELGLTIAALGLAFALFWPSVSNRTGQQGVLSSGNQGIVIPSTFQVRINYWNEFFVPALMDHIWLGTGTVIPPVVPTHLLNFVDNEYLREGFRAGIPGLILLFIMLTTVAVIGGRARSHPDLTRRSLGSTALVLVGFFALIGFTAEYMFFGGVSQEFAMILGLLAAAGPIAAPAVSRQLAFKPGLAAGAAA
jgi:hypothetical protein